MYNLGQVLYDKETRQPVIYCGCNIHEATILIYRGDDNPIEHLGRDVPWTRFTHYVLQSYDDTIDFGTFVAHAGLWNRYFGMLAPEWLTTPEIHAYAVRALEVIHLTARPYEQTG